VLAPGHKTTEAIGYAIMALLIIMLAVLGGVVYFFVSINRRAKAVASAEQQVALA
jgi:heme/copper-type cytochrome/quinol oxidase subunit 2